MKVGDALEARLKSVAMLVLDVDGVLTRGEIIYSDQGAEAKAFNAKDGLGLSVARVAGLTVALMTGRTSLLVERRARDLRIAHVFQRVSDKVAAVQRLCEETGIPRERVAFMGDDLNDREAMRWAGVAIAPADASVDICEMVDLITNAVGGQGAVREAVEVILRAQGVWEEAVERYLVELAQRDVVSGDAESN